MDFNTELIADRRCYVAYLWSSYSLIYIYDFRSEAPAIPPPLLVKFKLVSEASKGRELLCSGGLLQTRCQIMQVNETGARSENKGRANRLTNPHWALCHPTHAAPGPISTHTHQAAEKLPHLIAEISPKPPPFSAEVLSVLWRSDKLSSHSSLPSMVWFPSPPPVPISDRLLFIF